jgi:hypothetical protein
MAHDRNRPPAAASSTPRKASSAIWFAGIIGRGGNRPALEIFATLSLPTKAVLFLNSWQPDTHCKT